MVKRYLACVLHNRIYRDYIRFNLTKGSLLKISAYSHRPWINSRIVISLFSPVDFLIMWLLVMLLWYLQFLWIQRLQRYHFLYLNFHFRSFCHFFSKFLSISFLVRTRSASFAPNRESGHYSLSRFFQFFPPVLDSNLSTSISSQPIVT